MIYNVTSRHFNLPEVFRKYIELKLTKLEKTYRRITSVTATIEMIRDGLFECKVQLQLPRKDVINSVATDHSIVKVFDESFDKAYRSLRTFKDRIKDKSLTARVTRRIKRNLT